MVALQRRHRNGSFARMPDAVFHGLQEHRMSIHFDERVESIPQQMLQRRGEQDRLAQVASPIFGVQTGAVFDTAAGGGIQRYGTSARPDIAQKLSELAPQRIHVSAVGG